MAIKQFNATYLDPEDRLLFRFNTADESEYRFWLTRRITLFILSATTHLTVKVLEQKHAPEVAKAIAEFEQDVVKTDPQSKGISRTDEYLPASKYPLGADPILVMDAKCTLEKQGDQDSLSLDFVLPGGANVNLKLASPILQAMCSLLDQLRERAKWGPVQNLSEQSAQEDIPTQTSLPSAPKNSLH